MNHVLCVIFTCVDDLRAAGNLQKQRFGALKKKRHIASQGGGMREAHRQRVLGTHHSGVSNEVPLAGFREPCVRLLDTWSPKQSGVSGRKSSESEAQVVTDELPNALHLFCNLTLQLLDGLAVRSMALQRKRSMRGGTS